MPDSVQNRLIDLRAPGPQRIGLLINHKKTFRNMPNQLARTYQVVNRIKGLTPLKARVFMPPGDRMEGSFRSAAIQILYPREIFFAEDENFASRFSFSELCRAGCLEGDERFYREAQNGL